MKYDIFINGGEMTTVEIIQITEEFTWYKIGQIFTVIFDEYVNSYMAVGKGGAGRYIDINDVKIMSL
jgi:hypothetical protein